MLPQKLLPINKDIVCPSCKKFSDLDPSVPSFTPNISNYASQNNNNIKNNLLSETGKGLPTLNPWGQPFYLRLYLSNEAKNDFVQPDILCNLGSSLNPCAKSFFPQAVFEPLEKSFKPPVS